MKKLLSIFGTIALTTTASISVISCKKEAPTGQPEAPQVPQAPKPVSGGATGQPEAPKPQTELRLNEQVAKDLGLIDENGKSLVDVIITYTHSQTCEWDLEYNVKSKKASDLLGGNQKPKSKQSEDFLKNTLKLINDDGSLKNEIYDITVVISEIKPIFDKKQDKSDYEVVGGNFKLQFVKTIKVEKLGENYTVDLRTGNGLGLIKPMLNFNLNEDNFNDIPDFNKKSTHTKPIKDTDIYPYLNASWNYQKHKLEVLSKFIDRNDLITIKVTDHEFTWSFKNWNLGDKLLVKIYFGSICSREYKLTVR